MFVRTTFSRVIACGHVSAHLEDHAGGDDGGDTQLHEGTSVTGHHHSEPVERVRGVWAESVSLSRAVFRLCSSPEDTMP
jgi:hypothetical protein